MGPIAFSFANSLDAELSNRPLLHIDTGLPSRREAFGKQLCTALSYAPEIMIKDTDLVVTTPNMRVGKRDG
jgi:hypothetical protein